MNRYDILVGELYQQIDELVAALEAALKTAEFEKHPYRPWQERARHAIARAKGE